MDDPQTLRINVTHSQYVLFDTDAEAPVSGPGDLVWGNGLVDVNAEGTFAMVMTGTSYGLVEVTITHQVGPPPLHSELWDEVVEVGFHTNGPGPMIGGPLNDDVVDVPLSDTDDAEGEYRWWRFRVHARGRDTAQAAGDLPADAEPLEHHLIQVWPADQAPAVEHKHTDSTGVQACEPKPWHNEVPEPSGPQDVRRQNTHPGELTVELHANDDTAS